MTTLDEMKKRLEETDKIADYMSGKATSYRYLCQDLIQLCEAQSDRSHKTLT